MNRRAATIGAYCRGERRPSLSAVVAMAAALDCTVDDLLHAPAAEAIPA